MPGLDAIPPFPTDVPTHPLLVVDYQLLRADDEQEVSKLWKAATELGFWYLKNHGVDEEVNGMFDVGAETFSLPIEEKMKYYPGDDGGSFGYKAAGTDAADEHGSPDNVEFLNITKDDVFAWPKPVHGLYPSTVAARMDRTVIPFVRKALEVNYTLLDILGTRLGLPAGTMHLLHPWEEHSGSEARCIKSAPRSETLAGTKDISLGAHTDFGSLSFLHNRLGGLQVMVPGSDKWQYVKPVPGHAICNLGDAMAIFSGGILKSNLHRVIPPPGEQAQFDRWSVVFFIRPGDSVVLRPLSDKSELISKAVASARNKKAFETNSTAGQWFARRNKYQRLANRTGPETWQTEGRGTEHQPTAV